MEQNYLEDRTYSKVRKFSAKEWLERQCELNPYLGNIMDSHAWETVEELMEEYVKYTRNVSEYLRKTRQE